MASILRPLIVVIVLQMEPMVMVHIGETGVKRTKMTHGK